MKKNFFIIPFIYALSGCGDSKNIELVKGMVYSGIDRSIDIGNVLDTRKMCSNYKWTDSKDERNRVVVNYSCVLSGYDDLIKSEFSIYDKNINDIIKNNEEAISVREDRQKLFYLKRSNIETIYKATMSIPDDLLNVFLKMKIPSYADPHKLLFISYDRENAFENGFISNEELNILNKINKIYKDNGIDYDKFLEMADFKTGVSMNLINIKYIRDKSEYTRYYNEAIKKRERTISEGDKEIKSMKKAVTDAKYILDKKLNYLESLKITQNINFSVVNGDVVLISCSFNYDGNSDNNAGFYSNPLECLEMAYASNYNNSYKKLFEKLIYNIMPIRIKREYIPVSTFSLTDN